MVEISVQRKAFLDMLAWSEGNDNDVETGNHGYDVIVGGELFTGLLRSPSQTCHAKPKTQTPKPTLPLLSVGGCLPRSLARKTFSEKSGRCGYCSRLRSVALYL